MNKKINVIEQIDYYDNEFIDNISLENIKSNKELKDLNSKLEEANYVVTNFYQMLYNDYIISINSECKYSNNISDLEVLKKYKTLANKIQNAYKYISYIFLFKNPFKRKKQN